MHTFLALVTTAGNMPYVDISGNMHYPYSIGLWVPYMFVAQVARDLEHMSFQLWHHQSTLTENRLLWLKCERNIWRYLKNIFFYSILEGLNVYGNGW